ncbi:HD domain-containing protein [Oceanirhabdus sp. W0125-5]|uniref:HD domain-containing protein n=1 Tax=Oceanirhabdus sp. W0125-5 TaxID=2999116 RepID=UPI0022F33C59|nr:HD domain-containing protein [Oceanirhabdus sp. W0125-5]WBW98075.1 HD domain-containing protein [Oceanirhabdus sp. W0125-5]
MTNFDKIPTLEEAKIMLKEAEKLSPTPWVQHSMNVAKAAELIAKQIPEMDSEKAYILGLLHDIGRRAGKFGMRHSVDGYKYAVSIGYDDLARICLTHVSFEYNNQNVVVGNWDDFVEDKAFALKYLSEIEYTDYDNLIKLCDSLSLPEGFCLIEKRLIEMSLRGGVDEYTIARWKSTFEIKKYFESKMGQSIYNILPGVVETTFNL